jgi:hypothetical protein
MTGRRVRRGLLATRLAVLMLCALALPLPAAAADWTLASSDHFEIYTTAGARTARETLAQFERIRAFFAEQLKLTPPVGRPVRLILFSNERQFRPYRINDAVVAYYRPGPDRDYIVMRPLGQASHAVVVHEYVHLVLYRSGGRYPVWLNEGLAEYFATLPASGDTVPVGGAPGTRVRELAHGRFLSLERLFAVTQGSPEYQSVDGGGQFYAQSWALTHMLLSDDRYRDGVERFLTMVRRGTPSARAVTTAYGRSLAQVMGDLEAYVREGDFHVRSVHFQEPPRSAAVATRKVSAFDAGLVTANLFAAASEDAEKARAAFEELARQRADDLSLLGSRAALEIRTGRPQAAAPFLRRAVDLGTTDAETYRTLAALTAARDGVGAEALLSRSLELDPSSVRARVQLATLVAVRSPADALTVLEPVTNPNPFEAFDVIRLRAQAYLALGDLVRAEGAARDLVEMARSGPRRSVAAALLSEVDARRTAREAQVAVP